MTNELHSQIYKAYKSLRKVERSVGRTEAGDRLHKLLYGTVR